MKAVACRFPLQSNALNLIMMSSLNDLLCLCSQATDNGGSNVPKVSSRYSLSLILFLFSSWKEVGGVYIYIWGIAESICNVDFYSTVAFLIVQIIYLIS